MTQNEALEIDHYLQVLIDLLNDERITETGGLYGQGIRYDRATKVIEIWEFDFMDSIKVFAGINDAINNDRGMTQATLARARKLEADAQWHRPNRQQLAQLKRTRHRIGGAVCGKAYRKHR